MCFIIEHNARFLFKECQFPHATGLYYTDGEEGEDVAVTIRHGRFTVPTEGWEAKDRFYFVVQTTLLGTSAEQIAPVTVYSNFRLF